MQFFRPVGLHEMRLIYEADMRAFPPRLPEQPIFYPVLNVEYATKIARDWNTQSSTYAGYVTQFTLEDAYAAQFETHIVGSRLHAELWIPAERLPEFNSNIQDQIAVVAAYFGPQFRGCIPENGSLSGKDAYAQLRALATLQPAEIPTVIAQNQEAVFLHFRFWQQCDCASLGVSFAQRDALLNQIQYGWDACCPDIRLS